MTPAPGSDPLGLFTVVSAASLPHVLGRLPGRERRALFIGLVAADAGAISLIASTLWTAHPAFLFIAGILALGFGFGIAFQSIIVMIDQVTTLQRCSLEGLTALLKMDEIRRSSNEPELPKWGNLLTMTDLIPSVNAARLAQLETQQQRLQAAIDLLLMNQPTPQRTLPRES